MTIDHYIKMFKNIVEELSYTGHLVDDALMIFAFLRRLSTSYISFTVRINANLYHFTFEEIIAELKAHDVIYVFHQIQNTNSLAPAGNSVQLYSSQIQNKGNWQWQNRGSKDQKK
ncbi:unnamed protein product [Spirodela intermedia]|uniref:Uncharacterized protein n=1 Tax=Spirodela intermedia TaxID=51605 RepID=A0A7I8JY83_SPIIN|nr:unnamed protein product [Spirodela intermedia]